MFTINISFKDALTCFETLSSIKPEDELKSIESEFVKYAEHKAKVGDSAAEAWLKNNADYLDAGTTKKSKPEIFKRDNSSNDSPMKFFVGMKRPDIKQKQLDALENRQRVEVSLHGFDDDLEEEDTFTPAPKRDIPPLTRKSIDKAMKPLSNLVGLGKVKQHLRRMLESRIIDQRREKAGLKVIGNQSNHMVFTGNSGTGKTTVARILADIMYDLGFLSQGHLTEVSRADLVGEYIGQTEQITKEVLDKAKGGILFIDEAHALNRVMHSTTDFGQEVINVLLKYMEDYRDDLVVIVAGYPDLMSGFLRSNPGLKSRFAHQIHFDDMQDDALFAVFKFFCNEYDYQLEERAEGKLKKLLKDMKRREESEFPNGRGVRNLFEEIIRNQSERLLDQNLRAKKKLKAILAEDIPSSTITKDGNIIHLPRD